MLLLLSMCGEAGIRTVQNKVLKALPGDDEILSFGEVSEKLKLIEATFLFSLLPYEIKNRVGDVRKNLNRMLQGLPPKIEQVATTSPRRPTPRWQIS